MTPSRRDFLRLTGLFVAGATISACAPAVAQLAGEPRRCDGWLPPTDPEADSHALKTLSRLTFGPRLEERWRIGEIGLSAWIEEQLAPGSIDDGATDLRLCHLDTLSLRANELVDLYDRLFDEQDRISVPSQLRQATLLRQVYSRRQLYEVMVEFWSDHFNISVEKGDCWFLKTVDDRDVIRPHALGKYRDLLWASAHSSAMLVYLDNQANGKAAPNENYARELMELHTLGVNGGYAQSDVMELARCLTGWTVKAHFWCGDFAFDANMHDGGTNNVLGTTLLPVGQRAAERVLEVLAAHPSTARFIATKLTRRFIADDPPEPLVERAAATFTQSDGEITAVLRTILNEGLTHTAPKFKRPTQFLVSALRALDAQTDGGPALHDYLLRMGQPTFAWPTPDGYPDRADAWRGNLMPRWEFALELVLGKIPGTQINLSRVAAVSGARSPSHLLDQMSVLLLGTTLESPHATH